MTKKPRKKVKKKDDWIKRDSDFVRRGSVRSDWKASGRGFSDYLLGRGIPADQESQIRKIRQLCINRSRNMNPGGNHKIVFNTQDKNATDGKTVAVSTLVLDEPKSFEDKLSIMMGITTHEMGHVVYTNFKAMMREEGFSERKKDKLLHGLFNVIEDERIEGLIGEEYPGYADNLKRMKEYMFDERYLIRKKNAEESAAKSDRKQDALEVFDLIFKFIRYPKYIDEAILEKHEDVISEIKEVLETYPKTTEDAVEAAKSLKKIIVKKFEDIFSPPPPPPPPMSSKSESEEKKDDEPETSPEKEEKPEPSKSKDSGEEKEEREEEKEGKDNEEEADDSGNDASDDAKKSDEEEDQKGKGDKESDGEEKGSAEPEEDEEEEEKETSAGDDDDSDEEDDDEEDQDDEEDDTEGDASGKDEAEKEEEESESETESKGKPEKEEEEEEGEEEGEEPEPEPEPEYDDGLSEEELEEAKDETIEEIGDILEEFATPSKDIDDMTAKCVKDINFNEEFVYVPEQKARFFPGEEDETKYKAYKAAVMGDARRLANALYTKVYSEERILKGTRSGALDEHKIVEAVHGVKNVYITSTPKLVKKLNIVVLVDESGSMGSNWRPGKSQDAAKAAILINEAFKIFPVGQLFIYGFTSDHQHNGETHFNCIFRYREPGLDKKYGLGTVNGRTQNRDGQCIRAVAKRVREFTKEPALFFVISDGQPYAPGYAGYEGINDTRKAVLEIKKDKFFPIQIGIGGDDGIDEETQREMFDDFVNYEDSRQMVNGIRKLLLTKGHKYVDV